MFSNMCDHIRSDNSILANALKMCSDCAYYFKLIFFINMNGNTIAIKF